MKPIVTILRSYWAKRLNSLLIWPFKSYAFCLFALAILVFHTSAQGDHYLPLERAHEAVWKIHNANLGKDGKGYFTGTTFAIGPNLFVTNHHVLRDALINASLTEIVLSHPETPTRLRIHRVLALSQTHDLALLETTTSINGHLGLAHNAPSLEQLTHLTLIGYLLKDPDIFHNLRKLKQKGKVGYQDDWSYGISFEEPKLKGSSGGPVVDAHGKVIGVIRASSNNLGIIVRLEHLRDLRFVQTPGKKEFFTDCTRHNRFTSCMESELRNVNKLASQGNPIAQYSLWLNSSKSETGIKWLREAALGGEHPPSSYSLAKMLFDKTDTESRFLTEVLLEKAAIRGFVPAQFNMARFLWRNVGTYEAKRKAIDWLEEAEKLGYIPAENSLKRINR
ncbi:MAG: trypsin-like peptidase domain-containing protein [Rhodobacteraceae bacterium]|nr:trypsin-like peptidase domain-containing protein [Paracoccaceae bacterium]